MMDFKEIYENMTYGPAPESDSMAIEWLKQHNSSFDLFIDGKWHIPHSGKYYETVNPANKQVIAKIAEADEEDVDIAVSAAQKALKPWQELGGHGRARYLYAIARQIQKHSRLFAVLETMDNGKPIRESRDIDIPLVARHFYYHAGWAQIMEEDMSDYEALGVVGAIVPWNFPLLIFSWKVAPALAMGNTVVIKPAKLTSLSAILFAEICKNVGLPDGVFNLTTGSGSKTGTYIATHPDIAKITFTGSTGVGRILRKTIAGSGKKITLELGGKSPIIVFDDADLDSAIEGVVDAIWFNQGQVCCAGSRLLVQESIYDEFISKLKKRMDTLRVGDPMDKTTDIGAVVDKNQFETIDNYVRIGEKEGGIKYQPKCNTPDDGYYYLPTIFTDVSPADTIVREEIFGPVLACMSFRTPAEAVMLANNTVYGLGASIWSENINLALDVAPQVKAGAMWINCHNIFDAGAGFGGYKESGFGREGGIEGLWDFIKGKWEKEFTTKPISRATAKYERSTSSMPDIDRTAKLYIGGKQARPDGGYSIIINDPEGNRVGEVSRGNRKDIRNAVEVARKSTKWPSATGHNRAQVIYYLAENFIARADEFVDRLQSLLHVTEDEARKEVDESIRRLYYYAAHADKYDGQVHRIPHRNVTIAMPEPIGTMAIICPDEFPLLGFISTVIPAFAMGNTIVAIPSEKYPLLATDFYQILETSDVPAGSINIVTGLKDELTEVLAKHYDVDVIWYWGTDEGSKMIEIEASENMKRSWVNYGKYRNWMDPRHGMGKEFLRKSTEIKNIWVPYGE
ncbi:MAG: aldehyde dehydrogenase family protein [Candidatus Heimdallarchaeota archaeon]|nr:aldehyde dehydrogenase family protein [Candidatus Heimdallarchaeota archaeon]